MGKCDFTISGTAVSTHANNGALSITFKKLNIRPDHVIEHDIDRMFLRDEERVFAKKTMLSLGSITGKNHGSLFLYANLGKKLRDIYTDIEDTKRTLKFIVNPDIKILEGFENLHLSELLYLIQQYDTSYFSFDGYGAEGADYSFHYNPDIKTLYIYDGSSKMIYESLKYSNDIAAVVRPATYYKEILSNTVNIINDKEKYYKWIDEKILNKKTLLIDDDKLTNVNNVLVSLPSYLSDIEMEVLENISETLHDRTYNELSFSQALLAGYNFMSLILRNPWLNHRLYKMFLNAFYLDGVKNIDDIISYVFAYSTLYDINDYKDINHNIWMFLSRSNNTYFPVEFDNDDIGKPIAFDLSRNAIIEVFDDVLKNHILETFIDKAADKSLLSDIRTAESILSLKDNHKFLGLILDLATRSNVEIRVLNEQDFAALVELYNRQYIGQKMMYVNGVIYINEVIDEKTLLHEVLHPFIIAYKKENGHESISDIVKHLITKDVLLASRYEQIYQYYGDKELADEELLVEYLTEHYYKKTVEKDNIIVSFINKLIQFIKDFLGIKNNISIDSSIKDIIQFIEKANDFSLLKDDIARFNLQNLSLLSNDINYSYHVATIDQNRYRKTLAKFNKFYVDLFNFNKDSDVINFFVKDDRNKETWHKINKIKEIIHQNSKDIELYLSGRILIPKVPIIEEIFNKEPEFVYYADLLRMRTKNINLLLSNIELVIQRFSSTAHMVESDYKEFIVRQLFSNTLNVIPEYLYVSFIITRLSEAMHKEYTKTKDTVNIDMLNESYVMPLISTVMLLESLDRKLSSIYTMFNEIIDSVEYFLPDIKNVHNVKKVLEDSAKEIFKEIHVDVKESLKKNASLLKDLFVDFIYNSYKFLYEYVINEFDAIYKNVSSNTITDEDALQSKNLAGILESLIAFYKVLTKEREAKMYFLGQLKESDIIFLKNALDNISKYNSVTGEKVDISDNDKVRLSEIILRMMDAGVFINKDMVRLYIDNNFSNDEVRALLSSIDNNNIIISILSKYLRLKDIANKPTALPEQVKIINILQMHNRVGTKSNISDLLNVERKPVFFIDQYGNKRTKEEDVYVFQSMHKNYIRLYSIVKHELNELLKNISNYKLRMSEREIKIFDYSFAIDPLFNISTDKIKNKYKGSYNDIIQYIKDKCLDEYDKNLNDSKTKDSIVDDVINTFSIDAEDKKHIDYIVNKYLNLDLEIYLRYLDRIDYTRKKSEQILELFNDYAEYKNKLDEKTKTLDALYGTTIKKKDQQDIELSYYLDAIRELLNVLQLQVNVSLTVNNLRYIINSNVENLSQDEKEIYYLYYFLNKRIEEKNLLTTQLFSELKNMESIINNVLELKFNNNMDADAKTLYDQIQVLQEEYRMKLRMLLKHFEDTKNPAFKVEDIITDLFRRLFELQAQLTVDITFNNMAFLRDITDVLIYNNSLPIAKKHINQLSLNDVVLVMDALYNRMRLKYKKDPITGENLYYKKVSEGYEQMYSFLESVGVSNELLDSVKEKKDKILLLYKEIRDIGFIEDAFEFSLTTTYLLLDEKLEELNEVQSELSYLVSEIGKQIPQDKKKEYNKMRDELFRMSSRKVRPNVIIKMIENIMKLNNEDNRTFYAFVNANKDRIYEIVKSLLALSAIFEYDPYTIKDKIKPKTIHGNSIVNNFVAFTDGTMDFFIKLEETTKNNIKGYNATVRFYVYNMLYEYTIYINDHVFETLGLPNKSFLHPVSKKTYLQTDFYFIRYNNTLLYHVASEDVSYHFNRDTLNSMPLVRYIYDTYFEGFALGNRYVTKIKDITKITPHIIGLTVDSNNNFLPLILKHDVFSLLLEWMINNIHLSTLSNDEKRILNDRIATEVLFYNVNGISSLPYHVAIGFINEIIHRYPKSIFFRFLKSYIQNPEKITSLIDDEAIVRSEGKYINFGFFDKYRSNKEEDTQYMSALLDIIIWFIDFQDAYVKSNGMLYLEYPRYNIKMSEIPTSDNKVSKLSKLFGWAMLTLGFDKEDETFSTVAERDYSGMYDFGLTHLPLYGHHNNPIERTSVNAYSLIEYVFNAVRHNATMNSFPLLLTYSYFFGLEDILGDVVYKPAYNKVETITLPDILPKYKYASATRYMLSAIMAKTILGQKYMKKNVPLLKAIIRSGTKLLIYSSFAVRNPAILLRVISNFNGQQLTTMVRSSSFIHRDLLKSRPMFDFKTPFKMFVDAYKLKMRDDIDIQDLRLILALAYLLGDEHLTNRFLFRGIRFSKYHPTSLFNGMYIPKEALELYSRLYAFSLIAKTKNIMDGKYSFLDIVDINSDGYFYNKLKIPGWEIRYDKESNTYIIGKDLYRWLLRSPLMINKATLSNIGYYESPYSANWLFIILSRMRTYVIPSLSETLGVPRIDPETGQRILPVFPVSLLTFSQIPRVAKGIVKNNILLMQSWLRVMLYLLNKTKVKLTKVFLKTRLDLKKNIYVESGLDAMHYILMVALRASILYSLYYLFGLMFLSGLSDDEDDEEEKNADRRHGLLDLMTKMLLDPDYGNIKIGEKTLASMSMEERKAYAFAYVNAILMYEKLKKNKIYQQFLRDYDDLIRNKYIYNYDGKYINISDKIKRKLFLSKLVNGYDKAIDALVTKIIEREGVRDTPPNIDEIEHNIKKVNNTIISEILLLGSTLYTEDLANPMYLIKDKKNTSFYNLRLMLMNIALETYNQLSAYHNPIFEFDQTRNIFNNVTAYENVWRFINTFLSDEYEKNDMYIERGSSKFYRYLIERYSIGYVTPDAIGVRHDIKNAMDMEKYNLYYKFLNTFDFFNEQDLIDHIEESSKDRERYEQLYD